MGKKNINKPTRIIKIPAPCWKLIDSFKTKYAKMQVPIGSPRMLIDIVVADTHFNIRLKMN